MKFSDLLIVLPGEWCYNTYGRLCGRYLFKSFHDIFLKFIDVTLLLFL